MSARGGGRRGPVRGAGDSLEGNRRLMVTAPMAEAVTRVLFPRDLYHPRAEGGRYRSVLDATDKGPRGLTTGHPGLPSLYQTAHEGHIALLLIPPLPPAPQDYTLRAPTIWAHPSDQ